MKTRRAVLFALAATMIMFACGAMGAPGDHGQGGGNGGGRGRGKKKVVANGTVVSVDAVARSFVLHKQGGRGNGRDGASVVIATDENTVFLRSDEAEASFADLTEGVKAQAKGKKNEDGSLQATRILIKIEEEPEA